MHTQSLKGHQPGKTAAVRRDRISVNSKLCGPSTRRARIKIWANALPAQKVSSKQEIPAIFPADCSWSTRLICPTHPPWWGGPASGQGCARPALCCFSPYPGHQMWLGFTLSTFVMYWTQVSTAKLSYDQSVQVKVTERGGQRQPDGVGYSEFLEKIRLKAERSNFIALYWQD